MAGSTPDVWRDVLRKGADEFRRFINPMIAMRAELAGEPVHLLAARGGALIDASGQVIEDLHGTQAFGHRNEAITAALQGYLASDAPSWFPSRVNPFAGRLARISRGWPGISWSPLSITSARCGREARSASRRSI